MKRMHMMLRTWVVSMFLFLSAGADAQGVIVYPKSGAPIKVSFDELDCISTYDYTDIPPIENGHEYVDLGLSVKWATMNIGATTPEDYGDYFAWGAIHPQSSYGMDSYRFAIRSGTAMGKYCIDSQYGRVDNKTVLELEDDAARTNWGGNWRMPTIDEIKELKDNCTGKWTTQNGVKGYKVTSKINGNSIFLPAAGRHYSYFFWMDEFADAGSRGYYWSNALDTIDNYCAQRLYFASSCWTCDNHHRSYGLSVRAVCP